jgi:hypothetical protein
MAALLYLAGKFAAYSFWCFLGLKILRKPQTPLPSRALAYGFLRLLLGFCFGALIWFLSALLMYKLGYGFSQNVATYLLVYVPVRWLEWTIMAILILPGTHSFSRYFIGTSSQDRLWRLGGIAISCIADIPLIISLGGVIPTGRFLC